MPAPPLSSLCLPPLLLAIATAVAVSAAPFQCGNESRLETETIGGRLVTQRVRLAATAMHGCQWVLDGGDFTRYVTERGNEGDAETGCQRVTVTRGPTGGTWKAEPPNPPALDPRLFGKCQHRLGVDCLFHLTSYHALDRACPYAEGDPICPKDPRQMAVTLAGRQVAHAWIQLDLTPGNASSCAWVLLGSSHSVWTHAADAGAGRACVTCSRRGGAKEGDVNSNDIACSAPSGAAAAAPAAVWSGCRSRLGPDCRTYTVDSADSALPCRAPPAGRSAAAAIDASGNRSSSDAAYLMTDKSSARPAALGAAAIAAAAAAAAAYFQLLR